MARAAPTAAEVIRSSGNHDAAPVKTDEQLLQQFLAGTGESAEASFATLVERYGAIVHRVCLDVSGCSHDAEDAAQAVFLVLARKARSIRKPESLGPWLHGVAVRVARRAKSEAARRRAAERRKAEITQERHNAKSRPEVMDHAQLHEEIDRLPEKYRQPIILCYLQGQTQPQAARTLGWPLGTVQIRLHRGRERLRSRLTRSGASAVALTGADLTTRLSPPRVLPGREWSETIARAAVRFAAGHETAGLVAPSVARLAESVIAAMLRDSLKVGALTMTLLVLVSAGLFWTGRTRNEAGPELSQAGPATTPASAPFIKPRPAPRVAILEPSGRIVEKNTAPAGRVVHVNEKQRAAGQPARGSETARVTKPPPKDRSDAGAAVLPWPASPGRPLSLAMVGRRSEKTSIAGRELFERIWLKNDPRGHGGDGLGPVFNGQSCVGCHNLGGSGGAGAVDKNIEIATVTGPLGGNGTGYFYSFSMDFGAGRFEYRLGPDRQAPAPSRRPTPAEATFLAGIHPGFREANSTVLHRYGTDPAYQAWRGSIPGRHGSILIQSSERNPPPLFGAGRIDAIPDEAIEAAAKRRLPGSAQAKGRVSRLKDGRIGRFGWKAQTATLDEFVRSAAAGEIGLEVPGRHQAADPRLPGLGATGEDMDESECDALVEYVRSLSAPVAMEAADEKDSAQGKAGQTTFRSIGCTACHMPRLGDVEGIFSDLLLHDMGPLLADAEAYTVFAGDPVPANDLPAPGRAQPSGGVASVRDWRTPPLWGLRDSGPYLHDGRAATVAEAIMLHAGQGAPAARRYAELSPRRKQQVEAFLLSLAVPAPNR